MAIKHRNLAVQSQMSDTIFLDPEQFKRYRTRIVSTANKVNLKYETALPSLQASLSKCIAGIL
ncbi:complement resistance protein TraT [Desulfosarcina sp. BuS5]|uniref:complement resistance protein TraT n=1 Tax=Desulfosarcina sp. BuS5 TaxID=933262 RepID=UPI000A068B76|nr:complement resistance protein TraT [Desulfosarcina sp. BuS5]